ncbi:trypsin-like peptidase domain-containing protein [Patescibacteria group bacterium]|nr:trypsin-like peptidase domain-containing protein [Patescibacteria group bacterium]
MKNLKLKSSVVVIVLISLIVGGLAGTISGFYAFNYLMNNETPLLHSFLYQTFLNPLTETPKKIKEQTQSPMARQIIVNYDEIDAISAVSNISPSVVSIVVSEYVTHYYGSQRFNSPFFDDFFNDLWGFRGNEIPFPAPIQEKKKQPQQVGGGTGFVVSSKERLILTNKHVVTGNEAEYTVISNSGEKYDAEVLARDPFNDIAILKINDLKFNLPEVKFGNSDKIKIGQTVIAIGNSLGEYRNTVTKGVVSGISRRVIASDSIGQSEVLEDVIQTDAAINFGNSGGPLVDLNGEVVGINTAVNKQGQLIGFAIPVNQATNVVASVKKYGRIIRPYIGVRYVLNNKKIAQENNLDYDHGALIIRGEQDTELAIIPGSPANKAGLVENDIILEINNTKITATNSLAREIQKHMPGDKVQLKIYHQGEIKEIEVALEEYKQGMF